MMVLEIVSDGDDYMLHRCERNLYLKRFAST